MELEARSLPAAHAALVDIRVTSVVSLPASSIAAPFEAGVTAYLGAFAPFLSAADVANLLTTTAGRPRFGETPVVDECGSPAPAVVIDAYEAELDRCGLGLERSNTPNVSARRSAGIYRQAHVDRGSASLFSYGFTRYTAAEFGVTAGRHVQWQTALETRPDHASRALVLPASNWRAIRATTTPCSAAAPAFEA